ncbi:MAG: GtrA family protein [Ruminococcaceae bacterium]|nr:GtrA family protein [Oscillospiraceae bacterium]
MLQKIKRLLTNKELILYFVFGVGTTAVDFAVSYLLYPTNINIHVIHAIAWVAAVTFAYVTNKIYVFQSKTKGIFSIFLEVASFAGSRLFTLLLQEAIVWVLYDKLGFSEYIVKIPAAVLVVILNYVISKLLVFRKERKK